ncbi:hypothetical protein WBP06_26130 [Novosphingobium sp. BL-8H]|uniref:hypothetical protein n=1 Tax=Novosphingobium sp. BL-8H TaxID=3127640 RepID=UPI0037566837
MHKDRASASDRPSAPILPWRLIGGAFLHFVLPFYLLAMLAAIVRERPADAEALLHLALRVSPALLGGYVATAIAATGLAALIDPLLRRRRAGREARDPRAAAIRSERDLQQAVIAARALPNPCMEAALGQIAAARWNHDDPRHQALARDLAEAVESSTRALATAAPDRRPALTEMIAATIAHIASAQAELAAADARADETQARIVAGYVEARYGPSHLHS